MRIGQYAAENGPTNATRHFSKLWSKHIHEAIARRLRNEYLKALQASLQGVSPKCQAVKALATKKQGRPLLLGK